jgi:tetratricopeptide (TPR) repeat protein
LTRLAERRSEAAEWLRVALQGRLKTLRVLPWRSPDPEAFLPDLAVSLDNFANILSDLGQHQHALEHTRRSVDLYRQLAGKRPEYFLPDLLISLDNLGNHLCAMGDDEGILRAGQEAGTLRTRLAQKSSAPGEPPGTSIARSSLNDGSRD